MGDHNMQMSSNKARGDLYEIQIRDYIIRELHKPAYLWHETPETILLDHGIIGSHNEHRLRRKTRRDEPNPLADTGVDVIQVNDDSCSLIQCKNGYRNGLTYADLTGFALWLCALEKTDGYVYYTDSLSRNIRELPPNKRLQFVRQSFIENSIELVDSSLVALCPRDYQLAAVEAFNRLFKRRGILSMPCGTGKTLISYLMSHGFAQIVIMSPLKQFAKQNMDKYVEYGFSSKTLLVDSDGTRDCDVIDAFIRENTSFLISATFASVDVLNFMLMPGALVIVDEFHNLSKTHITEEDDCMYKLLNSDQKMLFMSATPRVYEMEEDDFELDIFGETIYNMSFTEAIEQKHITDYRIWLPSIHEDNSRLNEELSIYEVDVEIKAKCMYLFSCLINNGSRKCIVYCVDVAEIVAMRSAMETMNDFYCLEIESQQITSSDGETMRERILRGFVLGQKIQLLFSVRILDECIDIPSCDSIYITYPSQSKIRTIQRMCRCIRSDSSNPFKVGNVFIWCNGYDEILETLSGIKEYDLFFKDKILVNSVGFYERIDNVVMKDRELVTNYLVGIKEFKQLSWHDRLKIVEDYILANGKRPSQTDINEKIKQIGKWLSHQQTNYANNEYIMKDNIIRSEYEQFRVKFSQLFMTNEEVWRLNLRSTKTYIKENGKLPSTIDKNEKIMQLGNWLSNQQTNYTDKKQIMKDDIIRAEYETFRAQFPQLFMTNEEEWRLKLRLVETYIRENGKRPSERDKNEEIKQIGSWVSTQQSNYTDKKWIMKDDIIRAEYDAFRAKFPQLFMTNEEIWRLNLRSTETYIRANGKRPSNKDKNEKIKQLGNWLANQQSNYTDNKYIMKDDAIRAEYESFRTKFPPLFMPTADYLDKSRKL